MKNKNADIIEILIRRIGLMNEEIMQLRLARDKVERRNRAFGNLVHWLEQENEEMKRRLPENTVHDDFVSRAREELKKESQS